MMRATSLDPRWLSIRALRRCPSESERVSAWSSTRMGSASARVRPRARARARLRRRCRHQWLPSSERDEAAVGAGADDQGVTLPGLAATASNSNPAAALAVLGALAVGMAVLVGLGVRIVLRDRRALRFCPRCGADAIADVAV